MLIWGTTENAKLPLCSLFLLGWNYLAFLGEGRWHLGRCRRNMMVWYLYLKLVVETNGFGISFLKENCFWRHTPSRLFDASSCCQSSPTSTLLIWYGFDILLDGKWASYLSHCEQIPCFIHEETCSSLMLIFPSFFLDLVPGLGLMGGGLMPTSLK